MTTDLLFLCTVAFGIAVGLCELIGRYRVAPFEALKTPFGLLYIAVNGLASGFAYGAILRFGWTFGVGGSAIPLVQALTAGFGAMALFRSSLLTVKIGGADASIGPGFAFQSLLFATDREVDRIICKQRSAAVATIMKGISFALAKEALPNYCFERRRNVRIDQQQSIRQAVGTLAAKPPSQITDSAKALILGLLLMNSFGKEDLESAVHALGPHIRSPICLNPDILGLLKNIDFDEAFRTLPACCFAIADFVRQDHGDTEVQSVSNTTNLAIQSAEIPNATNVIILAMELQQIVGEAVLLAALCQISAVSIKTNSPSADFPGKASLLRPGNQ